MQNNITNFEITALKAKTLNNYLKVLACIQKDRNNITVKPEKEQMLYNALNALSEDMRSGEIIVNCAMGAPDLSNDLEGSMLFTERSAKLYNNIMDCINTIESGINYKNNADFSNNIKGISQCSTAELKNIKQNLVKQQQELLKQANKINFPKDEINKIKEECGIKQLNLKHVAKAFRDKVNSAKEFLSSKAMHKKESNKNKGSDRII